MELVITAGGMCSSSTSTTRSFEPKSTQVQCLLSPTTAMECLAQQHHAGGGLASEEMATGHRVVGVADVMSLARRW